MDIAATTIWVSLLVLLALAVGGVLLQIFLSKREARWPGLLLPGLTVLYSVLMVCSVAVYDGGFPWRAILAAFLTGNIPTAVLLAVYAACREKRKKKSELDKMRIDDL